MKFRKLKRSLSPFKEFHTLTENLETVAPMILDLSRHNWDHFRRNLPPEAYLVPIAGELFVNGMHMHSYHDMEFMVSTDIMTLNQPSHQRPIEVNDP